MTFTITFRRLRLDDPQGPLCRDWEANLSRLPWDGYAHDSCWAIVTGGRQ